MICIQIHIFRNVTISTRTFIFMTVLAGKHGQHRGRMDGGWMVLSAVLAVVTSARAHLPLALHEYGLFPFFHFLFLNFTYFNSVLLFVCVCSFIWTPPVALLALIVLFFFLRTNWEVYVHISIHIVYLDPIMCLTWYKSNLNERMLPYQAPRHTYTRKIKLTAKNKVRIIKEKNRSVALSRLDSTIFLFLSWFICFFLFAWLFWAWRLCFVLIFLINTHNNIKQKLFANLESKHTQEAWKRSVSFVHQELRIQNSKVK